MKYLKIPHCWIDDERKIFSTTLRLNPFTIEAFHAKVLEFDHPTTGEHMEQDITTVVSKSGAEYDVMLKVAEFEKLVDDFYAQ